ncbi:MAG: TonB-dependent receptor [Candidatus Azobacteroides sp.]|nr:TonB-dependent receptor [Candidatus Azobacteroides sp.]
MINFKSIRRLCFFLLLIFGWTQAEVYGQNETIRKRITGTVLDEFEDPVIGASVMVKGTTNGAITDTEGSFSLEVPDSPQTEIVVSFIGYETKTFRIDNRSSYLITLGEDSKMIDEVVVVGYGVQKKSVVTAAISRVTAEDLEISLPTRIDNMLKGKVSGVTITGGSGQPGSGSRVTIRGLGTINNSNPIYIVDGLATESIDFLNPTDIQSVEILKDAASAAIYGTRAANGVILITTKSGKRNTKTSISYDVSIGWQNPWKKRTVLDGPWYQTILNEMQINDGKEPYFSTITNQKGTDWQDEIFNYDAPVINHQVSISGGNEKSTYYLSLGYFDQEGIVGGNFDRSNYTRWSVRMNSTYNVFDDKKERKFLNNFLVGVTSSYSQTKSTGIAENSLFYSPLGSALLVSPTMTLYAENPEEILATYPNAVTDKNGRVYAIPDKSFNEIINPVANMQLPGTWNYSDRFTANFWGELDLYEGLKFKSSYNADFDFASSDSWSYPYYLSSGGAGSSENSSVNASMSRLFTWQVENTLTYTKRFLDTHNLTVLLGQSAMKSTYKNLSGTAYGLPNYDPYKATLDYTQGDLADQRASGGRNASALASYFGRVSYDYKEKYLFQATLRRDGSDKFGTNNRWAMFPSFSLGWNITEENFMANRPSALSFLKLRGSWGKNGNQQIDQYGYMALITSGSNYTFGKGEDEKIITGVRPARLANPDLKWETSVQTDIGLEMGFFNNSFTVTIDYFNKVTKDMLMVSILPSYIGVAAPWTNGGEMKNSGIELDLSYRMKINEVNLSFSGNISYLKNKLIDYGNETGSQNLDDIQAVGTVSRAQNGEVYPYFYGYKTAGIFQTQQEIDAYVNAKGELLQPKAVPGDVIFVDHNGDGVIDDDDRTKIGKGMPDFTFGFTLAADWRGFDFNAFFQGVAGNDVFDASRRIDLALANQPAWILDRWTGPGTSNKLPRVTSLDPNNNWRSSDLFIKNGSYLRLKTLQVGYTLPDRLLEKIQFQKIRFYVAAENLLTFTNYDGFDPEIGSGGTSLGIDMGCYPQARTISIGANITF